MIHHYSVDFSSFLPKYRCVIRALPGHMLKSSGSVKLRPMKISKKNSPILGLAILFFSLVQPAPAYIDAGSASLILQGLLGALAILAATVSLYWRRCINFLLRKKIGLDKDEHDKSNERNKED